MLEICKASAGSGKTHKLTGEYISKLLGSDSMDKFRHILAVTFTNKATDEMKQRILEELYKISLKDSDPRKEKAGKVLVEILNDYSSFNVSTIDRFFQQTLRAFARETGLYSSYNLSLEQDSILTESIDLLMDNLSDNNDLLEWLIKLSIEAIESGEGWNPIPKLKELGGEIFSEEFKVNIRGAEERVKDKKLIESYRNELLEIVSAFKGKSQKFGKKGLQIISECSLDTTSFIGGSRSCFKLFEKWASGEIVTPNDSFKKLTDGVESWYSKSTGDTVSGLIRNAYSGGLSNLVEKVISLYQFDYKDYISADVILGNLYTLGILFDIYSFIDSYCKKKNLVIISQTTDFLNKIIDGSDTPFIYEKIGGRIDNYMLDEFQDTSSMQWDNFRPLVKDSLDGGNDSLIVGDVKQSIYRWRNSDWNLLNSQVYKDFNPSAVKKTSLDSNWRSFRNIVEFNNSFFKKAAEILQGRYNENSEKEDTLISDIYTSFEQKVAYSGHEQGHVSVSFIDRKENENGWKEAAVTKIPLSIDKLIECGYSLNDMAVLVRSNAEGSSVANYLLSKGYRIISEESLLISSSESVQKIVATLKYLANPNDPLGKYLFKNGHIETEEKSLYSICEDISRSVSLEEEGSGAFIQAFMDCVSDYVSINGSDISGFVRWWDDVGRGRSISAPEGDNAIRILTIHKSKGLGFKAVIIPFLSEAFYREKGKIMWCSPDEKPFNKLGIIPIKTKSTLKESIFAPNYLKELLYSYVDSLNISYVAFTRAKEELIIYAPMPKFRKDGTFTISSISDALYFYCQDSLDSENVFTLGEWNIAAESKYSGSDDAFFKEDGHYLSIPIGERLHLSFSGTDFLSEDNIRSRGVLMHDILSEISVDSDLDNALKNAVSDGRILPEEAKPIGETLKRKLLSVSSRHWFDGTYRHYNESAIIDSDGNTYRPDRIMIKDKSVVIVDYKFGKIHGNLYRNQVNNYISLMKEMGYEDVSGFLWYLNEDQIEAL